VVAQKEGMAQSRSPTGSVVGAIPIYRDGRPIDGGECGIYRSIGI